MELELKSRDLELKNQALTIQLEADENLNQKALKILKENRELQEEKLKLKVEVQELKERLELVKKGSIEEEKQKDKDIETFREKIIRQYARSGKAICNGVKNSDGWSIETKFYINGYSRLSIYLPNKKPKLIDQPRQVDNFWRWLFDHQHRVNNLVNEKKPADISALIPFIGALIVINKKSYYIKSFQPVIGGVKMTIFNDDSVINIGNGYGSEVLDVVKCKNWIEQNSNFSKNIA
jgi:regulator of replication initiation timing